VRSTWWITAFAACRTSSPGKRRMLGRNRPSCAAAPAQRAALLACRTSEDVQEELRLDALPARELDALSGLQVRRSRKAPLGVIPAPAPLTHACGGVATRIPNAVPSAPNSC
jgi:hypothetical protein